MEALPSEEAKHYLRERVRQIEDALGRLDRREDERYQAAAVRRLLTDALFEHRRVHLEAELAWTREMLERVARWAFETGPAEIRGQVELGHR